MTIANTQGVNPLDNTGGSSIGGMFLFHQDPDFNWFGRCRFRGRAPLGRHEGERETSSGQAPSGWHSNWYDGAWAETLFYAPVEPVGFFGCDPGPFPYDYDLGGPTPNAIQTCASQGFDGRFVFSFHRPTSRITMSELGFGVDFEWHQLGGGAFCALRKSEHE